jgi:type IX secretion system PorP/SprF family membrane protein
MIITPQNIEKWFFDYFEGELTTLERKELEQFILENPQYHEDFKNWSQAYTNDNDVPLYVMSGDLLVKVAFYETTIFRLVATFILVIGFASALLYKYADNMVIGKQETAYTIIDYPVLDDAGDDFESVEIVEKRVDEYQIIKVPAGISEGNNDLSNEVLAEEGLDEIDVSAVGDDNLELSEADEGNNISLLAHSTNSSDKRIFSVVYTDFNVHTRDNYNIAERKSDRRYQFLDYRNHEVRGVVTTKFEKNSKDLNIAQIAESNQDKSGSAKRKSLVAKIQQMELGLLNINDPLFEIANYQPLTLNPSLAGQMGFTRVKSNFRNQFGFNNEGVYAGGFAIDGYINKLKAGMALNYQSLRFEQAQLHALSAVYSQKFELTRKMILGVSAEYQFNQTIGNVSRSFEVLPGNVVSFAKWNNNTGKILHNAGVSGWLNTNFGYVGLNVSNLLGNSLFASEEENYLNQLNLSFQAGTDYKKTIYSPFVVSPYVVFNKFGDRKELWMGTSLRYKSLVLGVAGSSLLSGKAYIGVQKSSFRLIYGYDMMKSTLANKHVGSHEVSLRLLIGAKYNNWSR